MRVNEISDDWRDYRHAQQERREKRRRRWLNEVERFERELNSCGLSLRQRTEYHFQVYRGDALLLDYWPMPHQKYRLAGYTSILVASGWQEIVRKAQRYRPPAE